MRNCRGHSRTFTHTRRPRGRLLEFLEPRRLLTNSNPTIAGGDDVSFTLPEHTAAVTTVVATDPDGDALTFDLFGADGSQFQIDPVTRVLSFKLPPNFSN